MGQINMRIVLHAAAVLLIAAASGLAGAAQAQTLTVWSGFPEMEPFYKRVGEGLKKKYPNLVLSVQAIPLREHEKRVALALPAGSAAEIIELGSSTAQRYIEAGLLKPAPDDVAALLKNSAAYDPFFLRSGSYDGKVYGGPVFRGQGALFYNTEMFEKAGLKAPPKSLADYTDAASKLTQRDAQGKAIVSGWSLRLSGGGQGIAEKFWINLFQNGGNLVEQKPDGKWTGAYANAAGRATLKQYLDNIHIQKNVTPEMPADAEGFERQQTAMFIRESWVIGDIAQKAPGLKYAAAPLPRGTIVAPVFAYSPLSGEKARLAWDFALAANEPENLVWLLRNVGWLPNRKDVDYSAVIKEKPALDAFLTLPAGHAFFELPAIGPVDEILTRLAARLVRAYGNAALAGNDAGIDAALKEAEDETNSILKREGLLAAK